ncbi:Zinc finger, RING/FYVE/PHD-type [Phytophthora cactorum]|nr:Zinc finger, RING/FYVE/PHD-type [Phytophthora cactorum]
MKSVTPFAAVHVTPEQTRRFESQARQLLDDTLREYDSHISACKKGKNPLHDKWQWKPLKTHEGLNVYKERQPTHPELNPTTSRATKTSAASASGHSANSLTERPAKPTQAVAMAAYTPEWRLRPVTGSSSIASVAVTGPIDGSLNDAMYGLMATDTAELQLRLRSMTDVEVHDTAMISCIQTPSTQEPFRFLGVQWLVRGEASRVKSSSRRPRDFVLLVASGVVQHRVPGSSESQEIGYYLCQSVEMQECGELESQGLTRGWMSTCSLFTPAKGSSAQIDVFSRGYVDFKGKMQDYQAAGMMTTLMLAGVTDAATCGQSKKLSWLLSFQGAAAEFRRMQPEAKASSNRCGICERKFGVLNSVASCNLCQVNMCSRCRVSRDLSFVKRRDTATSLTQSRSWDEGQQASGQVRCLTMVLCKNCKMNASHMDARVMARREVEAAYGLNELARTAPVSGIDTPVQQARSSLSSSRSESSTATREMHPHRCASGLQVPTQPRWEDADGQQDGSGKSNFSDSSARSKLESSVSSFASTLPSPRDRDSSQEESSFELTPFQPRHQHQPQYTSEDPEITYTYAPQRSANVGSSQAELVRRMQELQIKSESVYQFTSQMNANTRYRHQQFVPPNSSTSISELD